MPLMYSPTWCVNSIFYISVLYMFFVQLLLLLYDVYVGLFNSMPFLSFFKAQLFWGFVLTWRMQGGKQKCLFINYNSITLSEQTCPISRVVTKLYTLVSLPFYNFSKKNNILKWSLYFWPLYYVLQTFGLPDPAMSCFFQYVFFCGF